MAVNNLDIQKKKAFIQKEQAAAKEMEGRVLIDKVRELRMALSDYYVGQGILPSEGKNFPVLRGSDRKTVRLKMLELIKQF
jgi:hypothetical protein